MPLKVHHMLTFALGEPGCRYQTSLRYWFSFIMSIVWIWIVSWGMVAFAYHIGCLLSISSYIMGLVVLAAGTSIPDTLSSVMVAKRGLGDMVRNCVRSRSISGKRNAFGLWNYKFWFLRTNMTPHVAAPGRRECNWKQCFQHFSWHWIADDVY